MFVKGVGACPLRKSKFLLWWENCLEVFLIFLIKKTDVFIAGGLKALADTSSKNVSFFEQMVPLGIHGYFWKFRGICERCVIDIIDALDLFDAL